MKLTSLLPLILLTIATVSHAGIVNNSGASPEDSLTIQFQALDSIANPVDLASGDSVYLMVFYPSGAPCFRDSMAHNNSRITTVDFEDWNGGQTYSFKCAIADIDGAGIEGTYKYVLVVDDNTAANLQTSWAGEFQLYATDNYSDYLDQQYQFAQAILGHENISGGAKYRFVSPVGDNSNGLTWRTAYTTPNKALMDITKDSVPWYIFIGPGKYASACTVQYDYTHLIGAGYGQSVIQTATVNTPAIVIDSNPAASGSERVLGVEIAYLDIVGTSQATGNDGITTSAADSIHIHHCNFRYGQDAINISTNSDGAWIHDNVIKHYDHDGILIQGKDAIVTDNIIYMDSTVNTSADGIAAGGAWGIYYRNVSLDSLTAFGQAASGAWKNAFIDNFAYSKEPSGEFHYEKKDGQNPKYVANQRRARLLYSSDSSNQSHSDELFSLYAHDDSIQHYTDDSVWNAVVRTLTSSGASNWSDAQRDSVLRSLRWSVNNSLARLADVGLGSGAKSLVVFLIDTSGIDDTIPDVLVSVKDAGQTANLAQGRSLSPGKITFAVNASTSYVLVPVLVGYVWPANVAVTTSSGAAPDTVRILGYDFNPGTPASASLCRVYGWVEDLSSTDISGAEVRARIKESPLRYQSVVISPYERLTTTDSTGYWYLDLYPSSLLTPSTTEYEFEIRYTSGAILRRKVTVPNNASWLLTW